jgi:hypothetical protein
MINWRRCGRPPRCGSRRTPKNSSEAWQSSRKGLGLTFVAVVPPARIEVMQLDESLQRKTIGPPKRALKDGLLIEVRHDG